MNPVHESDRSRFLRCSNDRPCGAQASHVFGIGPINRPESPTPSGVAQGLNLIPVDSAGEVCCISGVR